MYPHRIAHGIDCNKKNAVIVALLLSMQCLTFMNLNGPLIMLFEFKSWFVQFLFFMHAFLVTLRLEE